jgi:hypothetical protein
MAHRARGGWVLAAIIGLLVLDLILVNGWLFGLRQRVRILQAVSVGMPRERVIEVLGSPSMATREDRRLLPGGEMLRYKSSVWDPQDIWVALGPDGRVVAVYYPDIQGPVRR